MDATTEPGTAGPAVTGHGPRLTTYEYRLPDDCWQGWVPGSGIEAVSRTIAERLADGSQARGVVRRSVELLNADALTKGSVICRQAVWVPDRSTGEVAAVLDATLLAARRGVLTPERHLARNLRRYFGWTTRIEDYAASTSLVPAGDLTIEQVLLRLFRERQVQGYLYLNVFPVGAVEAFSLILNTVHLDLLQDIARQGRMIAESLQLTLGEVPGGRVIE